LSANDNHATSKSPACKPAGSVKVADVDPDVVLLTPTPTNDTEPDPLLAVPEGVVTEIGPDVAPEGTTAVTCVSESTVNEDAAVPLNDTPVAPVKPVPVIVTDVPTGPLDGENPEIVGVARVVSRASWAVPIDPTPAPRASVPPAALAERRLASPAPDPIVATPIRISSRAASRRRRDPLDFLPRTAP